MKMEFDDEVENNEQISFKEEFDHFACDFADSPHKPVMPREVLSFIPYNRAIKVIDATVGCGGHSSLILKKNPEAVVLGLDRDARAIEFARKKLFFAGERVILMERRFSQIEQCAADAGWHSADIILMDLGLSSLQLDDPKRGFSYAADCELDMRMDKETMDTAERILNTFSKEELISIFKEYGEIKRAAKLADEIIKTRMKTKITRTGQLAEICRRIPGLSRKKGFSAPTLCFQALRIAVNNELEELNICLQKAVDLLAKNGKIIVISFNSLEDRIVKNFFRNETSDCLCPPDFPVCSCGHYKRLRILNKKPLVPAEDELKFNKRAASAKLRAAEKL